MYLRVEARGAGGVGSTGAVSPGCETHAEGGARRRGTACPAKRSPAHEAKVSSRLEGPSAASSGAVAMRPRQTVSINDMICVGGRGVGGQGTTPTGEGQGLYAGPPPVKKRPVGACWRAAPQTPDAAAPAGKQALTGSARGTRTTGRQKARTSRSRCWRRTDGSARPLPAAAASAAAATPGCSAWSADWAAPSGGCCDAPRLLCARSRRLGAAQGCGRQALAAAGRSCASLQDCAHRRGAVPILCIALGDARQRWVGRPPRTALQSAARSLDGSLFPNAIVQPRADAPLQSYH